MHLIQEVTQHLGTHLYHRIKFGETSRLSMEISKTKYEICWKMENSRLDKFSTFGLR